tara:strand:- start:146 stop:382 length:237 start_codon:yes stop_codon:yes gene_type:complete
MRALNEEITEKFLERLVDDSVMRLEVALQTLDISMDYIAALLSNRSGVEIGQRQKSMGRMAPGSVAADAVANATQGKE